MANTYSLNMQMNCKFSNCFKFLLYVVRTSDRKREFHEIENGEIAET